MESPNRDGRDRNERWGYLVAIVLSALGHGAFFILVMYVLPSWMSRRETPPPNYTVQMFDNIPAGDLGTHLPRLSQENPNQVRRAPRQKPKVEQAHKALPPKPLPKADKNAIALNTLHQKPTRTPTPTPTPRPTVSPSPATPEATAEPTAAPTPRPRRTRRPTPTPTPRRKRPRATPSPQVARARATPTVQQRLDALRQQLLKEHLAAEAKKEAAIKAAEKAASANGGPVAASRETGGKGAGVGAGTGSLGVQQDAEFLLYYQTVQQKIKDAWIFSGGSSSLTASVMFAIGADGSLTGVKVTQTSQDPAFDDSVVRAIRRAAPFPPPPEKYRDDFGQGVDAMFRLGELKS